MALKKRGRYWHYEFMMDGVRYWGTTRETGKERARTFEALAIAEVRNRGANPNLGRTPSLGDFSGRFLAFVEAETAAGHLDPDTLRYYRLGVRLLSTTPLAHMKLDRIGTTDASTINFGSPSYSNLVLRTLRRMLTLAVEWQLLRAAPKIKSREEHGRSALIESWMEGLLLRHADQPLADILVTIMDSGMRPEEAMRTAKEHIFWERNMVRVPYGKSFRSARFVPLSDRMKSIYARRSAGESPWIFPSARAEGGHLTTVAKQWREALASANEECIREGLRPLPAGLKLYCARHTFATDMLLEGMSIVDLMKLLGHSDVSTTMKYVHLATEIAAERVNKRNQNKQPFLVKAVG